MDFFLDIVVWQSWITEFDLKTIVVAGDKDVSEPDVAMNDVIFFQM